MRVPLADFPARKVRNVVAVSGTVTVLFTAAAVVSASFCGLTASYFTNTDTAGQPMATGVEPAPALGRAPKFWPVSGYSIEWTGFIDIPLAGEYEFSTTSDDGSELWIDNTVVADNWGEHPVNRASGTIDLSEGLHRIRVRYMQVEGDAVLSAGWRRLDDPDAPERPLATAVLFPARPGKWGLDIGRAAPLVYAAWQWSVATFAVILVFVFVGRIRPASSAFRGGLSAATRRLLDAFVLAIVGAMTWQVVVPALSELLDGQFGGGLASANLWPPLLMALAVRAIAVAFVLPAPGVDGASSSDRRQWPGRHLTPRRVVIAVTAVGALLVVAAAGADVLASRHSGLTGRYFDGPDWTGQPRVTLIEHEWNRRRAVYDIYGPSLPYSIEWTGFFHAPRQGDYRFAIVTDGVAQLAVASQPLLDIEGAPSLHRREATIRLAPGLHPLRIAYAHRDGVVGGFAAEYAPSVTSRLRDLPPSVVVPSAADFDRVLPYWRAARIARGGLGVFAVVLVTALVLATCVSVSRLARRLSEVQWHIALLAGTAVLCFSDAASYGVWGLGKLGAFPEARSLPVLVLALAPLLAAHHHRAKLMHGLEMIEQWLAARPYVVVLGSLLLVVPFFYLRNQFVNGDGVMYRWLLPGLAKGEVGYNFDEMLEQYLHVALWRQLNAIDGNSVRLTYQVASVLIGAAFVPTLWFFARRLMPGHAVAFAVLVMCGGYVQLFVGDVENYTGVAILILGYLFASERFVRAGLWLAAPAAVLALAMSFHMLAAFIFPSALVLLIVALRRKAYWQTAAAAIVGAAIIAATMASLGLSPQSLIRGSWGASAVRELGSVIGSGLSGGEAAGTSRWAFFAWDSYHWHQYNLFLLMLPAHLLLPLALFRRIRLDTVNVFLLAASVGMVFFHFNYRAMLPGEHDWNLFAPAAIPVAVLIWRNFLLAESLPHRLTLAAGWATVCGLNTYSWILSNHRFVP